MRFPLLIAALVFILPSWSMAWGGEGHQLIALIAEDQLTPQARAVVKELLDGGNISDAEVASWADEIRRERTGTAPWHYVNIPHDATTFDANRDGRDGENIIDAIGRQTKVLADKTQPREKRVEALKFIVHLVGDLHQPLHCTDRNGDRGGNSRLLFFSTVARPTHSTMYGRPRSCVRSRGGVRSRRSRRQWRSRLRRSSEWNGRQERRCPGRTSFQ